MLLPRGLFIKVKVFFGFVIREFKCRRASDGIIGVFFFYSINVIVMPFFFSLCSGSPECSKLMPEAAT